MSHGTKGFISWKSVSACSSKARICRRVGVLVRSGQTNCVCRNLGEPKCFEKAVDTVEETVMRYVALVVGLIHSRGVDGAMPVERMWRTRRD